MGSSVQPINIGTSKPTIKQQKYSQNNGDNIFASFARNAGMDGFADFLRDDWSAKTARKAGFNNFADWLENEKDGTNIFKEAIKHPVITIAAIAATVFAGKKVYDYIKTNNSTVNKTLKPAPIQAEPLKNSAEQIADYNQAIEEGIKHEKAIGFKNLEIFKDVPDKERQAIVNYFENTKREKDLLLFASGNKPALLENMGSVTDDLFDCLRSGKVDVAELILYGEGNLVLNKNSVKNLISENRLFFTERLGLAKETPVNEIYKLISKNINNPIAKKGTFADIKELLLGASKENAYYAQILEDIKNSEKHIHCDIGKKSFFAKSAEGIESFKEALKSALKSKSSSYKGMNESFIDKLLKLIDSISPAEYERRLEAPAKFFCDTTSEHKAIIELRDLAYKLELARKTSAKIGF